MKLIELTHSTWDDTKILVDADQIFGAMFHPEFKATVVHGPGNAHFTVLETPEKVMEMKREQTKNDKGDALTKENKEDGN